MRIVFGTDQATSVTESMVAELVADGHQVERVGVGAEWPEVGRAVGEAVAEGRADRGIACCFTGTGVSIAANKVAGVRAALCTDAATAAGARRWNDANVLALGLRLLSPTVAQETVAAFVATEVDGDQLPTVERVR